MKELAGKVAIITGGTGALGRAVASEFLAQGASVLCTFIDDAELGGSEELLELYRERIVFGKADVTRQTHVANVISKTVEKFSRVDALVNIVGGFAMSPVTETEEEIWDRMMNTNLKSAFLCSKAAVPVMKKNGWGRIVNVGSRPALKGAYGMSAYGASKAGVLNLTQSMAEEMKDHNITVNAVIPGTIDTPANRKAMPDADYSKWVPPGDIAKVIAFLASENARAVNGAFVHVAGRS